MAGAMEHWSNRAREKNKVVGANRELPSEGCVEAHHVAAELKVDSRELRRKEEE